MSEKVSLFNNKFLNSAGEADNDVPTPLSRVDAALSELQEIVEIIKNNPRGVLLESTTPDVVKAAGNKLAEALKNLEDTSISGQEMLVTVDKLSPLIGELHTVSISLILASQDMIGDLDNQRGEAILNYVADRTRALYQEEFGLDVPDSDFGLMTATARVTIERQTRERNMALWAQVRLHDPDAVVIDDAIQEIKNRCGVLKEVMSERVRGQLLQGGNFMFVQLDDAPKAAPV